MLPLRVEQNYRVSRGEPGLTLRDVKRASLRMGAKRPQVAATTKRTVARAVRARATAAAKNIPLYLDEDRCRAESIVAATTTTF